MNASQNDGVDTATRLSSHHRPIEADPPRDRRPDPGRQSDRDGDRHAGYGQNHRMRQPLENLIAHRAAGTNRDTEVTGCRAADETRKLRDDRLVQPQVAPDAIHGVRAGFETRGDDGRIARNQMND